MKSTFSVGDKVKIVGKISDDTLIGKTGVIIKDGGLQNLGFRKLGEDKYNTWLQQWIVKLDDTGNEVPFFEGALGKI